jgi:hypothetical protein
MASIFTLATADRGKSIAAQDCTELRPAKNLLLINNSEDVNNLRGSEPTVSFSLTNQRFTAAPPHITAYKGTQLA